MDELEISIMIGLDDMAHNRLYSTDLDTGDSIKVNNYGKRNPNQKCYCKELRKLGVRR